MEGNRILAASNWEIVMSPKRSFKKVVQIYCEGETEKNYLAAMFKDRYKGIRADFKPKITGTIESIMDAIIDELKKPETRELKGFFLVLDMDTIYKDKKLREFMKRKKELTKAGGGKCSVIESRPCIEYWCLLHFVFQDKLFVDCEGVLKELNKRDRLPGYEKKSKYTEGLYERLKNDIDTAIKNSFTIMKKPRQAQEQYSYTHMHQMIATLDKIPKA